MINKIKLILLASSALLITGGAFVAKGVYDNYIAMKNEISVHKNNERAYEDILAGRDNDNRVLRLSVGDLRHSKDKLIHELDSVRKSLKKPANGTGGVSSGTTTHVGGTTVVNIYNPDSFKLDTIAKFNDLTKICIKIKKNALTTTLDINNSMYLYVYSSREFVNEYKNGWDRFWHFDWEKETVYRYDIKNSNNLVKVIDSRVYMNDDKIE